MPEVLADRDPDPDAQAGRHGAQDVAGGEEPTLVEQAVGRQEQLAMDVPDLAVLDERGRDEQPVIGRFLHERHDGRQALGGVGELGQPRVVEAHRDLRGEVLQLVAGESEFREDDQLGARRSRLADQSVMPREVRVQLAELGGDLRDGDPDRSHARSIRDRSSDRA